MPRAIEIAHATRPSSAVRRRLIIRNLGQAAREALSRTQQQGFQLSGAIVAAQEEERRRIARDLHDDLAQQLAALSMRLARLHQMPPGTTVVRAVLTELTEQVEALSATVRRLAHDLHPSILEDLGLVPALRRLVAEFQASWAGTVCFEARGEPLVPASDAATALYRIAQETLRNIMKHAAAGPVTIRLTVRPPELCLVVQDSGPGFDLDKVRRNRQGLGLTSMQERAHLVGGTLLLSSCPTRGTTLVVRVPRLGSDEAVTSARIEKRST